MYKILTLNNISVAGLDRLPRDKYEVASEIAHPDAVLVRSANMHDMEIPETVQAIGRAGAGVNNIPVARMTERGVPVFNAPGANANAVKELVIAGMLLAARNIAQSWSFARALEGDDGVIYETAETGPVGEVEYVYVEPEPTTQVTYVYEDYPSWVGYRYIDYCDDASWSISVGLGASCWYYSRPWSCYSSWYYVPSWSVCYRPYWSFCWGLSWWHCSDWWYDRYCGYGYPYCCRYSCWQHGA